MKKRIFTILGIAGLCCQLHAEDLLKEGPFSGIDISKLPKSEAAIIRNANEDFIHVLKGHHPIHAVVDKEHGLPADGGTTFWKANGYKLTIFQSLSSFGKLDGFIYGPMIKFDKKFAVGNMDSVSSTRFYTIGQLAELKKQNANKQMQAIAAKRGSA